MKKVLKITGISLITIVLLAFVTPYLLPDTISREAQKWVNKNIQGEVKFGHSSLSFFKHFPSLTLSLNDFTMKGAAPFQKDTLLYAKELSFRVNLGSLLSSEIKIDQIFLDQADIHVKVDEKGNANYNVFKSKADTSAKVQDTSSTAVKIEGIFINKSNLIYDDLSVPMMVKATGLNYSGKGDLSKAVFDLKSNAVIDTLDLYYNKEAYLVHKKINAKLLTKINTNSLDLIFNENDLKINSLPIQFVGRFSFLKDGYDINFKTVAKETDLHNIFTALPPAIAERMEKTNIKGYAEINASLIGKYLAKSKTMPALAFNMKIRDGEINNPKAPLPIRHLFLNLQTRLPSLNPDSLYVNMDSLYFTMGKDHVNAVVKLNGLKDPDIHIKTRAAIDLEKWAKVFQLEHLKGRLTLDLKADGKYTKKVVRSGIRQIDTVIATIPRFELKSSLTGGYFKYASLPVAIDHINFNLTGENMDGQYKSTWFDISQIHIQALDNYIRGSVNFRTTDNITINSDLKSVFNFAELKSFYPVKDLDLSGMLNLDVKTKGSYNKRKRLFPVTQATIHLNNGRIKTKNFDQALEHIVVDASLVNQDGTLKGTRLNIKPVSFQLGTQPFLLKADVKNFDNVAYHVQSNGTIDIGKIYRLFALKGYGVKGTVFTNVSLQGLQSDAMAGRYGKLNNKGKVVVHDLALQSDLFPKSFLIKNGVFSFFQDKMKFEQFNATYGASDFKLDGELGNVVNYALNKTAKLTGQFNLQSKHLYADEFMVYNEGAGTTAPSSGSGVILIPDNLNVSLTASADAVHYKGMLIKNAKGSLGLNAGVMTLSQTGFNIIDAPVTMDATYKSLTPKSAVFDYHILAKEFDIARAYKEIKMFRELASSAAKAKGIVGLDYQLSGKLNQDMGPVYPSLKGGGTLSLKKISLSGFKFMNAVGKATKRDSLSNPDLSEVNIKSTISKNIITIERFKMRVAGFRPRFEGQVSFDGRLNMSGRLGLPPFGLIGIPLSITGTQDKPKVSLKRNKEGKLEETEE
ncbi:AsmA family protein [Pedobacter sp.]|uniref:AsmA family protein n=1 Tax=Pedobacter sp. TaxID=1411316 RepID=UPI002CE61A3B|nr:AsmA family protein [Pedobacter sp.]HWW41154.1 AsmA family protein [Pedobacter sp.]